MLVILITNSVLKKTQISFNIIDFKKDPDEDYCDLNKHNYKTG